MEIPSFQFAQAKNLGVVFDSSLTPHLICQQILLSLLSKYTQNLTTSHHFHCYNSGPTHLLAAVLLQ